MSDVIHFKPAWSSPNKNLEAFVRHCREMLNLYDDQGGFNVNSWDVKSSKRKITMSFVRHLEGSNNASGVLLDEPFIFFSKSYVRYKQSIKESTAIPDSLVALRAIHNALIDVHGKADILLIDGLTQKKVAELLDRWYPKADKLYRYGGSLEAIYKFLTEKSIAPSLPNWKRPWRRGRAKADRTDKESRQWQDKRCPSMHHMLALADCFAKASTPEDKYWSSVLVLLMFAPGRGGELQDLTIDCLQKEDGYYYVGWVGEKGFGMTRKWVPKIMEDSVIEAVERLKRIGQPARDAAKFAFEKPGKFLRHSGCITSSDFPENKPLNALEFSFAVGFEKSAKRIELKYTDLDGLSAWSIFSSTKWVKKIREYGNPSYQKIAQYFAHKYQDRHWPKLGKRDNYIWESLVLVREDEFHYNLPIKPFSWVVPTVNMLNDQLSIRKMKYPKPTIFQRFGYKDEDGTEIYLTSHQLRVWLSTNAERGGMDSWHLAQWAGRSRVEDNRHYDLRTQKELQDQAREIMILTERPTALQAIELNLPVAYVDLGINRIGVADVTEYGMCTHDYAMTPCTKGGECMICKEHVCIKGMPKTLGRMKRLEKLVASQLEKAKKDAEDGAFGADRWVTHLGWKLAHIRTQIERLESEDTPEGAVLWIPPEHDPSPVKRALKQQGYETEIPESDMVEVTLMKKLVEL